MWQKAVSMMAAVLILSTARIITAGELGHWAFDEGSGTTVRDSSAKGNHGTLVNGPLWVDGKLGKALQFDGVDDYVQVPHNASLIPTTGKATVSVWINAKRHTGPNGGTWQGILAKGGAPRLYNLYTHANGVIHFSTGPSGAYNGTLSTGPVPLNEWLHVAVVVDNAHLYYLNGAPAGVAGQGATVPTGGTANLTIGLTTAGEANYFLGMIDDPRIYDVALTAEQVKALFNGTPPSWPKARNPNPADGATGAGTPLFQWEPGDGALFHDVYIGTTPDLTEANKVATRQPFALYYHVAGLEPGVTYYWRIDEAADDGTVTTGDVWSFTPAPPKAYGPSLADGARNVLLDSQLSWSHAVDSAPPRAAGPAGPAPTAKGSQVGATFDPGPLAGDTTYYWRIDETKMDGGKVTGDVWSFRTLPDLPISDPNLVGWWKLDEEAGTFVMDSSGYGNHGTLRGNPAWVAGYDGGALQLDGVDDYVEVPHDPVLTVTSEVTVMAWIKVRNLAAQYQGVIAKGNATRSYSLYVQSAGTLHFSTTSAGAYVGSASTGTVKTDEWTHVCAMVVGGGHQYFINGELAGTGGGGITLPGAADTEAVYLGNTHESGRCFSGLIDDARVYTAALTQDQVQQAMQGDPLRAGNPQPSHNGEIDARYAEALSWSAGQGAAQHDVYFGPDKDAVDMANTGSPEYLGRQADTSFSLAGLVTFGGGDYFWRIDEVEADGATVHKGRVWSFTVPGYLIVDNFESYTDVEGTRIYETWIDGWTNGTGSIAGNTVAPFAELTVIHGGKQAMPMDFNNANSPFYSEIEYTFVPLQDWTENGVTDLSLWFRGNPARFVDKGNGAFTVGASGHDIWDDADDFRFVYKRLNGNGSVTVKVESLVNTNVWAKAGVMIRESLEAGSMMAYMIQSFSSGASFGWRQVSNGTCGSATQTGIVAPQWVKLTRTGNVFTAQYSADGKTWKDIVDSTGKAVSTTVLMGANVYIGLCTTSHNSTATTIAEYSGAATTGGVTGAWQVAWVGDDPDLTSDTAPLYAVVEDSAGKSAVVVHPDPAAVNAPAWTEWNIPLSSLTGVNPAKIKKLYLGVGDRNAPVAGGSGRIYIDDIRVTKP
jgi:regulation of enolase protein 1 (concanavalin A-like superfamily)